MHLHKSADSAAGFGIYYLFGDKVVMEHISDPESKVSIDGKMQTLPHCLVAVIDYADSAWAALPIGDRIKDSNGFKIFDDSTGQSKVQRLGVADPAMEYEKPKFNYRIYYCPEIKAQKL